MSIVRTNPPLPPRRSSYSVEAIFTPLPDRFHNDPSFPFCWFLFELFTRQIFADAHPGAKGARRKKPAPRRLLAGVQRV
jgi:hypothetical protein